MKPSKIVEKNYIQNIVIPDIIVAKPVFLPEASVISR